MSMFPRATNLQVRHLQLHHVRPWFFSMEVAGKVEIAVRRVDADHLLAELEDEDDA